MEKECDMCHFLAKLLGEDCLFFNVIIYFCDVISKK